MANTAAITLSASTSTSEQPIAVTCTVTNGGSTALTILGIQPLVTASSGAVTQSTAVAVGVPPIGPGLTAALPGSGTAAFSWGLVAHAPTSSYGAQYGASYVYVVGAIVSLSDGSVIAATTANLTVSNPSLL